MSQHVGLGFRSNLRHKAVDPILIFTIFTTKPSRLLPLCRCLNTSIDRSRRLGHKTRDIQTLSSTLNRLQATTQIQNSSPYRPRPRAPWTSRAPSPRAPLCKRYSQRCAALKHVSPNGKLTLPYQNEHRSFPVISSIPSLSASKSSSAPSTAHTSKSNIALDGKDVTKAQSSSPTSTKPILDRLPHLHYLHRPSKEELLAAATGFWSRLKVRFKWATIRSARPFNMDEIYAVFSWILFGHFLWIIVGTTTFFSLAILFVNTVFAQGNAAYTFFFSSL